MCGTSVQVLDATCWYVDRMAMIGWRYTDIHL